MNNNIDIEFVKYEFAKYSFQECLKFLDLHKKLHTNVQDNLSFGIMLSTAFVVTYARPFSNSNRQYYEKFIFCPFLVGQHLSYQGCYSNNAQLTRILARLSL